MRVKLSVKYFDLDDLPDLNDWLVSRGHSRQEPCDLPAVGFVVSSEDERIATCFLRRCEGNYGIIDGLASNPDAPGPLRHAALDLAIQMCEAEARNREITHLLAWSKEERVLDRAERLGFEKSKHFILSKEIPDEQALDS